MSSSKRRGSRLRHRPLLALATLGLAAISASGAAMSLALFTDTEAVSANAFTTGSVALTTSPTTALLTSSAMMPGDVVTSPLTLSNSGTAALRYSMTSSSTNTDSKALRDQLLLEIRVKTANPCGTDFTGTVVEASGALSAGDFGSNAAGAQTGDRTLAAGASEVLCFRVSLPTSTGNTFQGATTTTTFTFDSEQTANNP